MSSKKHASLPPLTSPISAILGQAILGNYGDPPKYVDPSRPVFQGQSRSLEPTRIDRLPMTSYLCFIVTMALSYRTVSEINSDICQKFPYPLVFYAPTEGFSRGNL